MTMREYDALLRREQQRKDAAMYLACLTGGLAAAAAYNAAGATKENGEQFSPQDFLPAEQRAKATGQTPQQMMAMLSMVNDALGGERVVSDNV